MRIRLTRKLADCLDGVDLSHFSVGDVLDLPRREAHLLIAEGWALPSEGTGERQPCTPTEDELRCIREQLENWSEQQNRRRAEDRVREELRDSRAVTVRAEKKKRGARM
jgi:hypothetical protein